MISLSVSIIINTYNRASLLRQALDALRWLRYDSFEVIVVNGPSEDGTEEVLQNYKNELKIGHCSDANLAKSRNIGLAMSSGDLVAFIDDDAIPEPDWLNAHSALYTDNDVGAVGGYIRDHTGYTFQCKVTVCDRFGDAESFEDLDAASAAGATSQKRGAPRYLSPTGANSSFRRRALTEIGGFDEEYTYFLDETDVAVRLIDAGWKILYQPSAEVHHKYAESHLREANRIPKTIYQPARSKAYFVMRHGAAAHGINTAFEYLAAYRIARRQDYAWLFANGWIDRDRSAQLVDEIARGTERGVADAFAYPSGRLRPLKVVPGHLRTFRTWRSPGQRLRACFLSREYPPGTVGGIGVWTHALAGALAARGHEISVVTQSQTHHTVDFEDGVWVHRVPLRTHVGRYLPNAPQVPQSVLDWCWSAYDEVQRIRLRRGLDFTSAPIWDVEGLALAAMRPLPLVTSLHSTYKLVLPSKRHWQEDKEYRRHHVDPIIVAEAWLIQQSSLILANTNATVEDVQAAYNIKMAPERLAIVPHGLRPPPGPPPERRCAECRILFVGRFELRKGIDILIQALPKVLRLAPAAHFVFVGDAKIDEEGRGPVHLRTLEELQRQYPDKITILGALSRDELDAQYRLAHIFVGPSRYESFGLVFLEAMRGGAACIGTEVGGIPEVIAPGETGLLVPAESVGHLADALIRLVDDRDCQRRFQTAGYKRFLSEFTAARMAELAEEYYFDLLVAQSDR